MPFCFVFLRYILCTAFSTTSALTDWSSVFYSVIYTSIPTIFVGILDKDLSHKTLLQYPKLYGAGYRQEAYNLRLFWFTMIDTLWQSLVLFYVPLFIYKESSIDIWSLGSLWTIAVVILVNVHLAMDVQRWVYITHAAVWGSIVITYACMVVLDSIPVFPNYWLVSCTESWLSRLICAANVTSSSDLIYLHDITLFCCFAGRSFIWLSPQPIGCLYCS